MPGGNRTTQHHCPQCFAIAKPRCFERGHLVCCSIHNVYHSPYSDCVQCEGAAKRAEREARKEKRGESSGSGSGGKSRKKNNKANNNGEEDEAGPANGKKAGKKKA
ncbi:d4ce4afe-9205-46cf-b269-af8f8ed7bebd [Thermothielavioides terrestris]|uniref:D4ce4afe-9205-46cf-b269-af8f8ed7bebd n=1 Tax=Thermothielavioides terrestris TaxID=2587410 RepID=A0A3S4F0K3_9PEZI|nr:d4ce4afe-9205-46cf-b269-af8f8ed7bebd [Thermothielavioides terrestris]